ncbi:unnamed protein product [Notodromas monacha]|uniref:Uncharacterized protein n=1 Tax=Notodromas monacha TaxID=399045 RepID=A0A7R9BQS8_9CRUS|nr:unnamed protein product [Notodromas monacha]CAG0919933.1 unnamed protein product [Notodromas monacha]
MAMSRGKMKPDLRCLRSFTRGLTRISFKESVTEAPFTAGRIPTNFLRREIGSSEREILAGRMIDRSVRPVFPVGYFQETQLVCNLLSVDGVHDPDIVAINAASAALSVSDVPWDGPIAAVRIGSIDNELIVNPTRREMANSALNLVLASLEPNRILMIEASAEDYLLQDFQKAVKVAAKACQPINKAITELRKNAGKPKRNFEAPPHLRSANEDSFGPSPSESVRDACRALSEMRLKDVFTDSNLSKVERDDAMFAIKVEIVEKLKESFPDWDNVLLSEVFWQVTKTIFRDLIFDTHTRFQFCYFVEQKDTIFGTFLLSLYLIPGPHYHPDKSLGRVHNHNNLPGTVNFIFPHSAETDLGRRCDGRSVEEVRPIHCEVDLYSPLHGSSLFQRGQTQVLSTLSFDSPESALKSDPVSVLLGGAKAKNFFLHYEFPPYATNETGRSTGFGRRELGHGALAEKALRPVIPADFPCITSFLLTRRMKPEDRLVSGAASWVTGPWRRRRCVQSSLQIFPSQCDSLLKCWNPMGPHRWPRFAGVLWL